MQINNENPTLLTAATVSNLIELGGGILAELNGNEIRSPNPEAKLQDHYDAMAASINRAIMKGERS